MESESWVRSILKTHLLTTALFVADCMSVVSEEKRKQRSVSDTHHQQFLSALCQRANGGDQLAGMGKHSAGKEEVGIKLMLPQGGRTNGS